MIPPLDLSKLPWQSAHVSIGDESPNERRDEPTATTRKSPLTRVRRMDDMSQYFDTLDHIRERLQKINRTQINILREFTGV